MFNDTRSYTSFAIKVATAILLTVAMLMWGIPKYRVYTASATGKAELSKAEFTRQIATLDAQAEIQRAKGVAEANRIIGESLHNNEGYLRYLWITSLKSENHTTVYIPTEAGLPILEANRGVPK